MIKLKTPLEDNFTIKVNDEEIRIDKYGFHYRGVCFSDYEEIFNLLANFFDEKLR